MTSIRKLIRLVEKYDPDAEVCPRHDQITVGDWELREQMTSDELAFYENCCEEYGIMMFV